MTTSTAEIVVFSLTLSLATFLITFTFIQDIPWLFIIDWILIGLYGLCYLLVRSEYKKNLVGKSWERKYYKTLNYNKNSEVTPQ